MALRNSILATGGAQACDSFTDKQGNNVSDFGGCGESFGNPRLQQLANNGGPTQTMALIAGSPALDTTNASGQNCTPTDQRGTPRPIGAKCDSGAYEGSVADEDADGDGIGDLDDNCPSVSNASQTNTDNDALGNACDPDDDGDGVSDGPDNCDLVPNASQTNTDNDALGNACDPDDDGDGVNDGPDNCDLVSNANQADNDHDGSGNACDATPGVPGGGGGSKPPVGGGGGGGGGGGSSTPAPAVVSGFKLLTKSATASSKGVVVLKVSCPGSAKGNCKGRLSLTAKVRKTKRARARTVKLGKASFSVAAGKSKRLKLKLSRGARRLLAKSRRLRASLAYTVSDSGGAKAAKGSRKFTLKAPKRRRR